VGGRQRHARVDAEERLIQKLPQHFTDKRFLPRRFRYQIPVLGRSRYDRSRGTVRRFRAQYSSL
jgi:hypothetical protein